RRVPVDSHSGALGDVTAGGEGPHAVEEVDPRCGCRGRVPAQSIGGGDARRRRSGLPTLALGASTEGAVRDRRTDAAAPGPAGDRPRFGERAAGVLLRVEAEGGALRGVLTPRQGPRFGFGLVVVGETVEIVEPRDTPV